VSQPLSSSLTFPPPTRGLGLDAGGTQTRWAVADTQGELLAEGSAPALSGLQLDSETGLAHWRVVLGDIAKAAGPVHALVAGITGFDATQLPRLRQLVSTACAIAGNAVQGMNDIELACRAAFAPGGGYVVYAGTGSVAAFVDGDGQLHRAGGRGVLIDDAGGGHWIAREALRHVWRAEDEQPGAWRNSRLAACVFEHVGGSDWSHTRQWVYGASRGELGALALAVAAAADDDMTALAILQSAGLELARLARALLQRHGLRPLVLAGRVFDLHATIESTLRAALPSHPPMALMNLPAHHAAARLAVRAPTPWRATDE
jgi:glucosamine kinase